VKTSEKPHRIFARISSHFIGEYNLNDSILASFQDLGEMTGADRIYLYRIHHKAKLAHITTEWLNKKARDVSGSTTSFALADFSWIISELTKKEMIHVSSLEELPSAAANEKDILTAQKVNSFILFPFKIKGKLEGIIGLDYISESVGLTDTELEILKVSTELIGFSLEKKLSEKSLRKTEKLYQIIFENTGAATVTIRTDTEISMVNSEFEKLTGFSRKKIEGKMRLVDLVVENDRSVIRRYHHLLMSNPGGVPKNYEFNFLTKNGDIRTGYMTGSSLLDTKNCIISFIDISDFKEAERQLIVAKEKAEESDRLKSAFLANVSHEIRTPLNAITGFSALLANTNLHLDKKEKYIKQILNGSNELVNLIDNVLDISRIESDTLKPKITEFLLNENLNETLDFYNDYKIQHGKETLEIRLKLPMGTKNLMVKTDRMRLKQILANILENAIKFTSSGAVEFGYSILKDAENGQEGQSILFFIKDSGIGIAKKNLKKVFDRFVKIVDKNDYLYRGAGLGLALAKDLVRLLGGEIWVESNLGKGSSFYFTIPYEVPEEEFRQEISGVREKGDWTGKTILVAEDTESNYMYVEEILSDTNAKLIRAKDGLEAVELFKEFKPEIDLVLMDILMPEYDGYEATQRIRKMKKNIPVIAQTAFTFEGELIDGLYAGCFNDYITKPFNIKGPLISR
jgi:PAS domain S-box-containing protein